MKKKPIGTIQEAREMLQNMEKAYYNGLFEKMTRQLWQARMDEIFSFYQGQIKACLVLAFKRNLTSNLTYAVGFNSLKYLQMHIHEPGKPIHFVSGIGMSILAREYQEIRNNNPPIWTDYSCTLLDEALKTLQLYFDHLNDETLPKQWE